MQRTGMKRVVQFVPLPFVAAVFGLLAYGAVMVWSATSGMKSGSGMFVRQMIGMGVGLGFMALAWAVDYRRYIGWLGPIMFAAALLVISPRIPGLGATAKGATSWLQIAGVRLFQPSEPAKLLFIIVMASVIARFKGEIAALKEVGVVTFYMGVALVLILLQPDLGTGLVFVAITVGMLLVGGMKAKWFAVLGLAGVLLTASVIQFGVPVRLEEYQLNRLLVFVDPTRDPGGAGYNLAQSKIAIGSGGLTGQGLGSGTQGNLHFLPERHTDFIFSVLGEELGFTGAMLLLAMYLGLFVAALEVAASSRDLFGTLLTVGVMSMWLFQVLVNIGMTVGIMPITGIPLPFMSFGSSFMVTNMAATGMLLSVWSHRYGV